jgi:hypothetical protein
MDLRIALGAKKVKRKGSTVTNAHTYIFSVEEIRSAAVGEVTNLSKSARVGQSST